MTRRQLFALAVPVAVIAPLPKTPPPVAFEAKIPAGEVLWDKLFITDQMLRRGPHDEMRKAAEGLVTRARLADPECLARWTLHTFDDPLHAGHWLVLSYRSKDA